jgi:hypothetical protein
MPRRALIPGADDLSRLIDPVRFDKMPRSSVQQLLTMATVSAVKRKLMRQFTGFLSTALPPV